MTTHVGTYPAVPAPAAGAAHGARQHARAGRLAGVPGSTRHQLQRRIGTDHGRERLDVCGLERHHVGIEQAPSLGGAWLDHVVRVGRDLGHPGPGALEAALDRRGRRVEHVGDLGGRERQCVPQQQHRPLGRGQRLHPGDEREPQVVTVVGQRLYPRLRRQDLRRPVDVVGGRRSRTAALAGRGRGRR
jgi:hypothetical protein